MRINLPGGVDHRTAAELRYLSACTQMFWAEGKESEALKMMELYNLVYFRWYEKNKSMLAVA